jgi:hypothetical protein
MPLCRDHRPAADDRRCLACELLFERETCVVRSVASDGYRFLGGRRRGLQSRWSSRAQIQELERSPRPEEPRPIDAAGVIGFFVALVFAAMFAAADHPVVAIALPLPFVALMAATTIQIRVARIRIERMRAAFLAERGQPRAPVPEVLPPIGPG